MTNEIKTGAKLGTKVGEAVVYVVFRFGSFAHCTVSLYEGLTMEECVALRGNGDIESYCETDGLEWHNVECSVDAVRGKLLDLRTEAEQTERREKVFNKASRTWWSMSEHERLRDRGIYDYRQEVLSDVIQYIMDEEPERECSDRDELEEKLNDELWTVDSVTGNGSGSYTFSRAKAEECVRGNSDLVREMVEEFCVDKSDLADHFMDEDWEWFDVSIRCYLLGWAIHYALDLLQDGLFYGEVA